jgi:TonB family protein
MKQGPLLIDTSRKRKPRPVAVPVPKLLVALEPWHRGFLRNLKDLLWVRGKPPLQLVSRPAAFWDDVFVPSGVPWRQFLQSSAGHILVIVLLWGWSLLWPQRPQIVEQSVFHSSDVVYYDATEYLAPLNTGGAHARLPRKGEPAHAAQPIISVPPEADNRTQTIVAPPNVKLDHDVPLPNVVAWGRPKPTIPTATMAGTRSDLKLPVLPTSVVAPAPDVNGEISRRDVRAPQAAIIEPPREVAEGASRLSDINIGHAQVVAPAPQLPMGEQRAAASMAPVGNSGGGVVPPPPSMQGSGGTGDGRLIALNLHPAAPSGPVDVPGGNRRGTFAATPEGKAGAAGTPDIPGDSPHAAASGVGGGHGSGDAAGSGSHANGIPPGLFVGNSTKPGSTSAVAGGSQGLSKAGASDSSLLASATPPRVSAVPHSAELPANATSELERKVFGDRKSYAMILNVPNLNSAGGSWVMHFAELKDAEKPGELVYPSATQQVDPGYPLELMKQNVQGTVVLSAVIRGDGSVGEVRVLRGIDDRLDQYASAALARWRFRPATRNGDPVALQTVVMIPFRPTRRAGF